MKLLIRSSDKLIDFDVANLTAVSLRSGSLMFWASDGMEYEMLESSQNELLKQKDRIITLIADHMAACAEDKATYVNVFTLPLSGKEQVQ